MNLASKLKQQYDQQVESAPWLAWALPLIALLGIAYLFVWFSTFLDTKQAELDRSHARLAQLQAISADQEWASRAEQMATSVDSWQGKLATMSSKTLLQAELLANIQALAANSNVQQIDVAVGEPVADRLNPRFVILDINIRISNTNGFAFEEFWGSLLEQMPYLSVNMIDVLHRGNRLQGRMSARVLAIDETE